MCRFVFYLGRPIHIAALTTEPENSLIRQSFASKEREEPLNGDGFGVAWYQPQVHDEAILFRSITPAWSNQNLRHLAKAIKSECILAHVRAASSGLSVSEQNTHPFVSGRYAFMHNGELADFRKHRRDLDNLLDEKFYGLIEGTTDTECLFAHILQQIEIFDAPTAEQLAQAMENAIALVINKLAALGVTRPSYVNALLSNGRDAVACRYSNSKDGRAESLHMHTGRLYTCESGRPRLVEADEDEASVIIASEPLTDDASWQSIPNGNMVVINADREYQLRPLNLEASG